MSTLYTIDQEVIITKFNCKIDSDIQYYSQQMGIIKGIKKVKNHLSIYLIEFLNHNRIWVMAHELKPCYNHY